MSDETKCVCGHAGFEHAGKTRLGNECLGDNLRCSCKYFTPPTPDPRERGEALAVAIIASEIGDAIAAHDSGENVSPETRARHVVAALRAPAPSEAVELAELRAMRDEWDAWSLAKCGVSWTNLYRSRQQARTGDTMSLTELDAMLTHPAPARGVTVTEAMVREWMHRHGLMMSLTDARAAVEDARTIERAALTPDAEGGA